MFCCNVHSRKTESFEAFRLVLQYFSTSALISDRMYLSILIRRKQDLGMFKATIFEVILGYPIFDVLVKLSMQNFLPISGRVDRASATETIDSASIPGQVKQKNL